MSGKLAAVDATKETTLASEFGVKGFPTLKYFADGRFMFEVPGVRDKTKLIDFMIDPKVTSVALCFGLLFSFMFFTLLFFF